MLYLSSIITDKSSLWLRETRRYYFGPYKEILSKQKTKVKNEIFRSKDIEKYLGKILMVFQVYRKRNLFSKLSSSIYFLSKNILHKKKIEKNFWKFQFLGLLNNLNSSVKMYIFIYIFSFTVI